MGVFRVLWVSSRPPATEEGALSFAKSAIPCFWPPLISASLRFCRHSERLTPSVTVFPCLLFIRLENTLGTIVQAKMQIFSWLGSAAGEVHSVEHSKAGLLVGGAGDHGHGEAHTAPVASGCAYPLILLSCTHCNDLKHLCSRVQAIW